MPYFNYYPNYQNYPFQNNGQQFSFIPASSEDYAKNYPVAPGNSVTFKDETQPFVYVKTMGFSQLDRPVFEKYRLVKENSYQKEVSEAEPTNSVPYMEKAEFDEFRTEFNEFKESYSLLEDEVSKLHKVIDIFTDKKEAKKK